MPISRTRSEMLASMMFMMPMPPTSRLMPGDEPAAEPRVVDEGVDLLRPILLRAEREILDAFVGAHEHVADLLQRFGQHVDAGDLQLQAREPRVAGGADGHAVARR